MKKLMAPFVILFLLFLFKVPAVSADDEQLVIINKTQNQLVFYENNRVAEIYDVATGATADLTPEGEFKVINKIVDRPYYKEEIPGGDPSNPLGRRWIGINPFGTNGNTYAIHGNNNPNSIGYNVSAGCIRMHNEEIESFFEELEVDTPVIITSSDQSFDKIGEEHGYDLTGASSSTVISTHAKFTNGSHGEAVEMLQRRLTILGYDTKGIDGSFGPATNEAVKAFQQDHDLEVDGIIDRETRKKTSLLFVSLLQHHSQVME
ncbi:L,D-transpeptidase family protein [Salipaludibacillus sp. CF4.18]|uniref:L,D-transpeptidase family protein n=1 Tax=Salipaludibacillus sp. CF4.18 TaxID=3373081 RepID=UPI003EE75ED2